MPFLPFSTPKRQIPPPPPPLQYTHMCVHTHKKLILQAHSFDGQEFLVVSSCLIQKAVAGGGLHTAVGVLSAFEVICKPGEGFDHYEVVLHASQQIPNIAHCLSGIRVPDASLGSAPVEPQGGDARSQAMQPAVLLGTEDSLLLVQLFIDDLALRSVEAVQSVMKALE